MNIIEVKDCENLDIEFIALLGEYINMQNPNDIFRDQKRCIANLRIQTSDVKI